MFKNRNLIIIALIAVVNALGYGIIIPVLYSYSKRFGLTDFQNGILFSVFSICQFISTPIIGRLSDKYGRRPLLLISLFGTFLSFILMAFAKNAQWLFIARIIDGITAGNISVASAVISDTTEKKDRAKGFGVIGASFGFGFVFGPAISGLTYGINPAYPFLIAGAISLLSFMATFIFLPETNKDKKEMIKQKIFDFKKMFEPIFDKLIGKTLLISLLYSFAFSLFIYGFQPFAVKKLGLGISSISEIFTTIGIIGVIAQVAFIQPISRKFGDVKTLQISLISVFVIFILLGYSNSFYIFGGLIILNSFVNSFTNPILQTIISKEVHDDRQGEIMGINSSYVGLGQIFGPIIGGIVATYSLSLPFVTAGIVVLICFILSLSSVKEYNL